MSTDAPRIAVLGAAGQLGGWLCQLLGPRAWGLDINELDITQRDQVLRFFDDAQPAAIVNCAAYTAVDRAESEREKCFAVNATAPKYLAEAANAADCPLVQISTDYVFGVAPVELRPWRETDMPSPRGVYAESKFAGEQSAALAEKHLIVRTCGLYGHPTLGAQARSFVEAILAKALRGEPLRVVDDQRCSPSYALDVARGIVHLRDDGHTGLFHVTNAGETNWYDFAREIVRLVSSTSAVTPISSAEYGAAAPRPSYSVLDTAKFAATGGPRLAECREALRAYLELRGVCRVE